MEFMITAKIVHETPKAVLAVTNVEAKNDGTFECLENKVWLPKSQIKLEPGWEKGKKTIIELPEWLINAKGL